MNPFTAQTRGSAVSAIATNVDRWSRGRRRAGGGDYLQDHKSSRRLTLAGSPVGVGRPTLRYEHVAWAGNGVRAQCPRVSPSPSLSPMFRGPREGRGYLPNSDEPERPCVLPKTKLVNYH